MAAFEQAFTVALVCRIKEWLDGADGLATALRHQRRVFTTNYRWENRVLEWKSLISLHSATR